MGDEAQYFVKVSVEAFNFFDNDLFFNAIAVANEDGCVKDAILGYL